jgi:arabinose-5-phosphate isomerase
MDLEKARAVLRTEAQAILSLGDRLGKDFEEAARLIAANPARLVVTGMGKAGLVGQKISATFASTGTPSVFLHPAEAYHGDLGRVVKEDVVLAISNSGETDELVRLLPALRQIGARIVAITADRSSALGKNADVVLELGMIREADPLGLAPSATTAAIMALGDALAFVVLDLRGFNREQFAFYHPGGELGRKLLKVADVMRTGERNPIVDEDTPITEAAAAITRARAGAVTLVNGTGRITGIFTDGDLRRALGRDPKLLAGRIRDVMTRGPVSIGPERLATEALKILREKKIDELPVVNERDEPVGLLDVQDLLEMGIV